jgi:hypothetical protein
MNQPWIKYTAVLVLGILLGLAGGAGLARHHFFKAMKEGGRKDPGSRILKRLDRELRFTAEQREKVAAILEEGRRQADALRAEVEPKFEALRKGVDPKFEAIKRKGEEEIRKVLTAGQAAKFDAMKARWEKWGRKHPRLGGPRGFMGGPEGMPPMGTPPPATK